MILFKKIEDLRKWVDAQYQNAEKIGFIPTMGALHDGHLSLVSRSQKENAVTVCSIFVNPTQFNDPKDFEKYPITLETDIEKLEESGCEVLFLPSVKEIYPGGTGSEPGYDLGYLETVLEGKYRPGHFQGVCMVVDRLLGIVSPSILYLGRKDYQQCLVIRKMMEGLPPGRKTAMGICPIIREPDGLAMSSRNGRLSPEARIKAAAIYESLLFIKKSIRPGNLSSLKQAAGDLLAAKDFRVDYVEIADSRTLELINEWDGQQPVICLVAAYLEEVRLIDNMVLHDGEHDPLIYL